MKRPDPPPQDLYGPCPECGRRPSPGQPMRHQPGCSFAPASRADMTRLRRDRPADSWPLAPLECIRCGLQARYHPATRHIVACLNCRASYSAVFTHFRAIRCTTCGCYASKHDLSAGSREPDPVTHCRGCGSVHVLTFRHPRTTTPKRG